MILKNVDLLKKKIFFLKRERNLCVEGSLCANVVGCGDLGGKDLSVVKGAVLRVGRISGLPGHCLGSMCSTSSSGSRSRSTELMGDCPESIKSTDSGPSIETPLLAVFLVQIGLVELAFTRSICSPCIVFKVTGGYQVILHEGYNQQLNNKIHHIFGYDYVS